MLISYLTWETTQSNQIISQLSQSIQFGNLDTLLAKRSGERYKEEQIFYALRKVERGQGAQR